MRPTAKSKPKPIRARRRPDPLATVTDELRVWFDAAPRCTSQPLLERLQKEHPGLYSDHLRMKNMA